MVASSVRGKVARVPPRHLLPHKRVAFLFSGKGVPLKRMARFQTWFISWSAALAISILRWTCRIKLHNDPRERLRREGRSYVYSILHAHQVAATIGAEPGTGAMVSRSADGQIIVPALKVIGCIPVRGSSRSKPGNGSKGGLPALDALIEHVQGGRPAILAVDGPRGPRSHVHKGIALLARESGAVVLNVVTVPTRRWTLQKAWDRMQIPKPFATIHAYFSTPLEPRDGEGLESFRQRIEASLRALEHQHDPAEAGHSRPLAARDAA